MSSYDGIATLESWLEHEVFEFELTDSEIEYFEKWRDQLERHLENYLDTDDGEGNNTSWRGFGYGFNCFSEAEEIEFDIIVANIKQARQEDKEIEKITESNYVKHIKLELIRKLNSVLDKYKSHFTLSPLELNEDDFPIRLKFDLTLTFKFGNVIENLDLICGYDTDLGLGIFDQDEDETFIPITGESIFAQLFFSLALKNLEEQYLL